MLIPNEHSCSLQVAFYTEPVQPQRPRLTLTRRNAEVLETAARAQTDTRLGAALRRLAAHGRPGPASKA